MKAKNVCNLPAAADITDADGIIITQNGNAVRMTMDQFRKYVGFASGADVLGVPVPTSADAGKVPTVNKTGNGYALEKSGATLLWKNDTPTVGFPVQTIAVPTDHKLFLFVMKEKRDIERFYTCTVPNIPGIEHEVWGVPDSSTIYSRKVTISSDGIHVDGMVTATNKSLAGSYDNYAFPYEIYGLA